jgi:hypothetical protein
VRDEHGPALPGPDLSGETMARYAPFATLAAVAALGGALFVVNVVNNPANVPSVVEQSPGAGDPGAAPPPVLAAPAPEAADPEIADPEIADPEIADPEVADPDATDPGAAALDSVAPSPPAVAEQSYAGRSAGNEVTVAIAVKEGRAVGYVCDGDTIEAWLEGTLEGETLSLRGSDGSTATVTGTSTAAATLGTVSVGGQEWPFSAAGVEAPAGLYEGNASVRGVATRVGWIVTPDGAVTGVSNSAGRRAPAPALDPADPFAAEVNGVPVAVSVIDGGDAVILR